MNTGTNKMYSDINLAHTIHERAYQRDCRTYRTAIDALDRTIDAMSSVVDDISEFTGRNISLSSSSSSSATARNKSGLNDEVLRLLSNATREKDTAQDTVNVLRQRLDRVSNVLHHLGLHRDKIHSEQLRKREFFSKKGIFDFFRVDNILTYNLFAIFFFSIRYASRPGINIRTFH